MTTSIAAQRAAWWHRGVRLLFAVYGVAAVATIPLRNLGDAAFSVANYFSYFTVLSNVLAIVVLTVGGLLDPISPQWRWFRGAVTLYMIITAIVYAVLLAGIDVMLNDDWINLAMHRALPLVLLIDWICTGPRAAFRWRASLAWLVFPLVYSVYTLVRGPFVGWYPYPFLDPGTDGWPALIEGVLVLSVAMAVMARVVGALAGIGSRRGR